MGYRLEKQGCRIMGLLTELELEITYRSDEAHLVSAFYIPCLSRSVQYNRAVGFFTSNGISLAAQGVAQLLKNDGNMRLVASPCLSEEDIHAIQEGYAKREDILHRAIERVFQDIEDIALRDRLSALSWLIANGHLEVKLAIRVNPDGTLGRGIYHEKIGIFVDSESNYIAFRGSSNETIGGLIDNFESIEVFWSWEDYQERASRKFQEFERLWENKTHGLDVIDFTEATAEVLRPYKSEIPPDSDPFESFPRGEGYGHLGKTSGTPEIPSDIQLRDYQEDAVRNWFKNNGNGTLKMATGSGKTITALAIVSRLYGFKKIKHLVVVCPFQHLVTQWGRECQRFGLEPILAFESRHRWYEDLGTQLYNVEAGSTLFLSVITTNKTFASDIFQSQLKNFPKATLILADEVHNLGAKALITKLPSFIRYRLGLSATPERWFDDSGSTKLFEYFGKKLEPEFTLKDAIKKKALVPYRYYPIFVNLTEDELDEYLDLSERIAKLWSNDVEEEKESPALKALLIRRARLIATAENKLTALRDLMIIHADDTHMLFYCGDGKVEDEDGEILRHVEAVCKLLGHDLGIKVDTFTAETLLADRKDLLERLDSGDLQGLVAIRCLDEGVDVPSIHKAVILASSTNPRQFIQRRGRILRPSPGKTHAEIYDMIIVPELKGQPSDTERNLMRRELFRYIEFADLALNPGEARARILPFQEKYGLLDM